MARDAERLGRFRREAKVLAQLDHPNIVTIYSVEESDGVHFLTMQLVDGQALDRLISQDGLPIERITEIGSALADALGSGVALTGPQFRRVSARSGPTRFDIPAAGSIW